MQRTPIANFALAGDWTATGWPATMESAVRSGYLAAEAVLQTQGMRRSCLVPELSPGRLARWFFSNDLPLSGHRAKHGRRERGGGAGNIVRGEGMPKCCWVPLLACPAVLRL